VVEPLTATALGGLALNKAQSAITKWVTAKLSARVEVALRDRLLRQGRPTKDQQTELAAVIKAAVDFTATEQFPREARLQGLFRKTLLDGPSKDWPLVNGSDLTYITNDVFEWALKNDPQPGAHPRDADPASHPYLAILCRNILTQYGFRAENNGAKNPILYPRWHRFWTTELFEGLDERQPAIPAVTEFHNDISGTVGTLVQAQHVTVQPEPRPRPVWPRRLGPLPERATARLERPIDQEVTDALAGDGAAVVCQILSGMGGVGKTQIAAHCSHQQWKNGEVDLLLWVNATTRDSITTAFAQAGSEFCDADAADSNQAANVFLDWLDSPGAPRWLVVLDDLTEPDDLRGLWPPTNEHGRTIVTTRRRDTALETPARRRIDVGLYTPDQALHYLTDRLREPALLVEAAELAADLGHLPLALTQAAVYILDQPGTTCATYRTLLADRTIALEQLSPELLPDGYPHTVAAALQLAIEHADQYKPAGLASGLLAVASLLDPADIPADLFSSDRTLDHFQTAIVEDPNAVSGQREVVSTRQIAHTLARMHRLSLLDYDGSRVRIHSLVQHAVRDRIDSTQMTPIVWATAGGLLAIWPQIENAPSTSAILRANVARLRAHAESILIDSGVHTVLFKAGDSLGETGQVAAAASYFDELVQTCNALLDAAHPHTFKARHRGANWRGKAGDPNGAVEALEALLRDQLQYVPADHTLALEMRHDLAHWRGEAGDPAGALEAFEANLDDVLNVYGSDHQATLATRYAIAHWRGYLEDPTGTVAALGEILPSELRVLGPDHPSLLATRQNIAHWRGAAGDARGALAALQDLLGDLTRVLGSDHPDTLATRHGIIYWRIESGDTSEAITQLEHLMQDQLRVLGVDHPHTRATQHELTLLRGEADNGDTSEHSRSPRAQSTDSH
jgi:hypothetical protein